MGARVAQELQPSFLLHPRGFARSAVFTCAQCGYLIDRAYLNRHNNCATCPNCEVSYVVGLHLYRLPIGFQVSHSSPPDAIIPTNSIGYQAMKSRSRERRIRHLASVGLAGGMLPCPLERAVRGSPVNRVEIVQEPTTSSDQAAPDPSESGNS